MGQTPTLSRLEDFPSTTYSLVAPYAADINNSDTSSIRYRVYQGSGTLQSDIISSYISSTRRESFVGTWMLVADWNAVPAVGSSPVSFSSTIFPLIGLFNGRGGKQSVLTHKSEILS